MLFEVVKRLVNTTLYTLTSMASILLISPCDLIFHLLAVQAQQIYDC